MAAKRTHELIPLCHPLPLTQVTVDFAPSRDPVGIRVGATAKVEAKTGVEMEALTAVSVACLTIYDMVKAVDRSEEHTSELQSLMRISYAVFCLKKTTITTLVQTQIT